MLRLQALILHSFIFLSLVPFLSYGQDEVVLEQNPPSVKWRQINTPSFRIIFPKDFETEAQRMANTMEHLYQPVSRSLGVAPKRLSILLQNQHSISNGFVTVAPRRSEFFSMPPQDYNFLGTNNWLNLLAVHEFRHVVQYQKSLTGFTKFMKTIFGGDVWSGLTHVAVPSWHWEGDAVAVESALTHSGRGRIPNFDLALRTTILERGPWNYYKQYLGSYKDYVPDYYVLGYHMVTHVRRNYGEEAWSNILTRTHNFPILPFRFSSSIRKYTGHNLLQTYRNMTEELDSVWSFQVDNLPTTESLKSVYRKKTLFTNYDYPLFLSNGRLVAIRSGIGDISQLVYIDSLSSAKKIFTLGMRNDPGMLSAGGDKIVWNEFTYDPRYPLRSYSVIRTYDLKNRTAKVLTRKTRLSGSSISPDGKRIVSIENATSSENRIVVHDAQTGKEIKRIENPSNNFFAMPRYSNDGKFLVVLKTTPQGKTITQFTSEGSVVKDLLPLSWENLGHPVQHNQFLLYNSPYSGIDNIYALNLETGEKYQVTSKTYGAYNPTISPDGKTLAFNNFTPYGMDVETMPFDPSLWTPLNQVEDRNVKYYEPLVQQENNENILAYVPEKKYEVKKFSQLNEFFNPFSLYLITDLYNREIGASIHSQNLLSTFYSELGVSFNGNESQPYGFGSISYQGLFPIFDLQFGIGTRAIQYDQDNIYDLDSVFSWTEKDVSFGIRIPLNLTRNKYYSGLNLSAKTKFSEITGFEAPALGDLEHDNGVLHSMKYGISYYKLLKQAPRDVTSRWGFRGLVSFQNTPFGGEYRSSQLAFQGKIQLPGLVKHHGFQVRGGYQTQEFSNYVFPTPVFFPRGLPTYALEDFYNTAVEYKFPIWNADFHIGPLLNFQRFKGKLFYDRGMGTRGNTNILLESYGIEIHTDFNILRWLPLIEVGARISYGPQFKKPGFDFLLFQFDL